MAPDGGLGAPLLLPQFPTSGSFTFQLAPYNTTIGSAGVIVDSAQGVATATIVKDPKEDGIYGIPPPGQYLGARPLLPCMPNPGEARHSLHACVAGLWHGCFSGMCI